MANTLSIANADTSNMTNRVEAVTIPSMQVDSAGDQDETEWINSKWTQQWGYFNAVPDLKSAILMKAVWNVGKGWTADSETSVILDHISGWGKDTFDDILFNMECTRRIGADAFAEIMRADDGTIVNLKPLDPSTIKIIANRKGIIIRYEQISKTKTPPLKFQPEEIFHLSNNRLASQIHGISDIDALEKTILAENQTFTDVNIIMHRSARPMLMFKLGTDDPVKIASFIEKMDKAVNKGENIYIPDDANSVSYEPVKVDVSPMLLEWRNDIKSKFYRTLGLPLVVFGAAGGTESGSKIEYLAHEQIFARDQRFIELQIWNQLGLKIKLIPPTTLLDNLQTDERKDANQGMEIQPSDMTAGRGQ